MASPPRQLKIRIKIGIEIGKTTPRCASRSSDWILGKKPLQLKHGEALEQWWSPHKVSVHKADVALHDKV